MGLDFFRKWAEPQKFSISYFFLQIEESISYNQDDIIVCECFVTTFTYDNVTGTIDARYRIDINVTSDAASVTKDLLQDLSERAKWKNLLPFFSFHGSPSFPRFVPSFPDCFSFPSSFSQLFLVNLWPWLARSHSANRKRHWTHLANLENAY